MTSSASRWKQLSQGLLFRYGLAFCVTALALLARWLLDPLLGDNVPYVTFFAGVVFLSMYVGWQPAMFSAVLALLAVLRWWTPSVPPLWGDSPVVISALVYLVMCSLIALLGHLSRRTRHKLQRAQTLFETFLDNSSALNFLKDDTGRYVYVNKTFTERFGHNVLGKTDFDLFPDYTAIQFREHELIALWEDKAHEFIEITHEADGEHTWISTKFPVIDSEGRRLLGGKAIDITERTRADAEVARLQKERAARDAAELEAMTRLHQVGVICQRKESTQQKCLEAVLDAAIFITGADKGNLQLYDAETNVLRIAVYRGFQAPFLEFFSNSSEVAASCGYAMRENQRTIVKDVAASEIFAGTPSLDVLLAENVHAVQSTPLISSGGQVFGVFSTHFSRPHRPDDRQLRLLDLLAQQTADYLERKQAEADLSANEERLRLASQAAEFGTYDADFAARTRYWSLELRAIVGLEPDASTGDFESVPEFVHPDDRARVGEKMRACHDPNGPGTIEDEHRIVRSDGSIRWVMMRGSAFFEGEGENRHPVRATGILIDVTQRKRAEADRAQLAAIVESSEDAIYLYNFEGVVRTWNHGAEKLYGWRAGEIVGQSVNRILPPELETEVQERIIPAVKRGETLAAYETRRMRRDGNIFEALLTASPLRNQSGQPVAVSVIARDITQRKLAEEALRVSERRFREVTESLPQLVWTCSGDGTCDYLSPQWIRYTGKEEAEQLGYAWLEQLHPEDRPRVQAQWEAAVSIPGNFEIEFRIRRHDGAYRWFHTTAVPLRDSSGDVTKWFGSNTDIDEIRRGAEALRSDLDALTRMHVLSSKPLGAEGLEPLFQEVMDIAVAILRADKGTLQLVEGNGLRIVAHHGHGSSFLEFFAAAEHIASVCGEASRQGERVCVEDIELSPIFVGTPSLAVLRQAGVRAVQSTPLATRTGRLLGILTTQWLVPHLPDEHDLWRLDLLVRQASDLIELAETGQAARDASAELRSFLEAAPTGLTRCSRDLRYISANPAYCKLAGLPAEQIIGRSIQDVMGAEGWERIRPHVDRVLAGERVEYEEAIPFAATGLRKLHVVYTPEMDSSGQVTGWIASVSDITDFSRLQQTLRKMEKLAVAGQLAASLAHEINNPLSTVVDAFYVLKDHPGLDEDGRTVVSLADAEVARLSRLVKQSLSYYRTGVQSKDLDLAVLVEQSLDIFSSILRGAGIEIRQKLNYGFLIPGYPDELRQVIDNLLLNAIEATPKGGRITVSVRKSTSWKNGRQSGVRLTIADSGCGMPHDTLANIYEPFFTTKSEKGTGFGLWVVNNIVSKHDGVIRIRTSQRVDRSGSVFSILFPGNGAYQPQDRHAESQSIA